MKTYHYYVEYKGKKLFAKHHCGAFIGVKKKIDLETDRELLEKAICKEEKFRKVEILRLEYKGASDPHEMLTKMLERLLGIKDMEREAASYDNETCDQAASAATGEV